MAHIQAANTNNQSGARPKRLAEVSLICLVEPLIYFAELGRIAFAMPHLAK